MTTPKLDFEWEIPQFRHALFIDGDEVDSDNFLFNKLRQLCQAVDEINVERERKWQANTELSNRLIEVENKLKDLESRQRIEETLSALDSNRLDKLESKINNQKVEKECNHDFSYELLMSNPPQIKCKSCGFTKVFGSTPDVFMKAECDHIWEAYTQCGNPNAPAIPACIKCGKIK